jgi:preprotein translocase subunit SecD
MIIQLSGRSTGVGLLVGAVLAAVLAGCSSSSPGAAASDDGASGDGVTPRAHAVLSLRPVLLARDRQPADSPTTSAIAPPSGSARPTDSGDPAWITPDLAAALQRIDCSGARTADTGAPTSDVPASTDDPNRPVVRCSRDGDGEAYLLGPAELDGDDVADARAMAEAPVHPSTVPPAWTIIVTLTDAGRARFAAVTGRLAGLPAPRDQFAVVVDGLVLVAPHTREAIPGGVMQITGDLTQRQARELAARLTP